MAVFPDIVRDLTEVGKHTDIPEVTKWYTKVLQHNVPNGKKNRGLAVVAAYKMLEDPNNLTPENIRLANILGWCVEMVSRFFWPRLYFFFFGYFCSVRLGLID